MSSICTSHSDAGNIEAALTSPIPVPTYGEGGTFSVRVCASIRASPEKLLEAVRDTGTWPIWNSFCPEGIIVANDNSNSISNSRDEEDSDSPILQVGSVVNLKVYMNGDGLKREGPVRDQGILVTCIDEDYTFTYPSPPSTSRSDSPSTTTSTSTAPSPPSKTSEKSKRISNSPTPNPLAIIRAITPITEGAPPTTYPARKPRSKKGCRIAWKSTGYSNWQLRSERVMEFVDDGVGGTEYVCWETFGGVLARVVKLAVGGQLVKRFADYAMDLRGFVERGTGVES